MRDRLPSRRRCARGLAGKRLDQKVVNVFHVNVFHVNVEGQLTERWLFPENLAAIDDFWS